MDNQTLRYLPLGMLLLAYISSLRAFRLDMPLLLKRFSFFLLAVFVGEIFGVLWAKEIYKHTPYGQNNQWWYNILHLYMYLFYFYFFYKIFQSPKLKKAVAVLCVSYILFAGYNFWRSGILKLNNYNDAFAGFCMVFFCVSYYHQLLKAREIIVLKNDVPFWICTGLLINELGSALGLFFITVLEKTAPAIHTIVMLMAVVMYFTYSIGYLCHKKTLSGKP